MLGGFQGTLTEDNFPHIQHVITQYAHGCAATHNPVIGPLSYSYQGRGIEREKIGG